MVYCQNAKFTEQRKSIENLKKKSQVAYKRKYIRISAGFSV